jgi:expansin (peptidoglycan-binding protein)
LYDNGKACGSYLFIVGPKDSIIARVTDRCPGCSSRTIDLSTQAFKRIATLSQGRVPIRWRFIPAPTNQPLSYHFKKNSNQWWMAVQIRNHRHPIAQVEYATTDSLWKKLDQTNYNYFVGKKTGPGPFIIKVTDIFGGTVIDSGIQLLPDSLIRSSGNFPGLYSEISNKDSLLK